MRRNFRWSFLPVYTTWNLKKKRRNLALLFHVYIRKHWNGLEATSVRSVALARERQKKPSLFFYIVCRDYCTTLCAGSWVREYRIERKYYPSCEGCDVISTFLYGTCICFETNPSIKCIFSYDCVSFFFAAWLCVCLFCIECIMGMSEGLIEIPVYFHRTTQFPSIILWYYFYRVGWKFNGIHRFSPLGDD